MRPALLLLALLVVSALAAAVLLLVEGEPAGPKTDEPAAAGEAGDAAAKPVDPIRDDDEPAADDGLETGAVIGLRAVAPSGSFGVELPDEGRTAGLEGTITVGGLPTVATLTVVAGPDAGATFATGPDGGFLWEGLYPGLTVMRVEAAGAVEREVLLRHRKTVRLDLAFEEPTWVEGRVVDEAGEPVADAAVTLDGEPTRSDRNGAFAVARRAKGPALLVVQVEGYVPYCERLRDGTGEAGGRRLTVELRRGATLELSLGDGPDGEVLVWLVATSGQRLAGIPPQDAYPWHRLNPLRLDYIDRHPRRTSSPRWNSSTSRARR